MWLLRGVCNNLPGLQWEGKPALRRRFRNDDGLGVVVVCAEGICRREVLTTGVVRHACRHRVTARGVFGFVGGRCCRLLRGLRARLTMCWPVDRPATHAAAVSGSTRGSGWFCGGALLPFVLRAVAGHVLAGEPAGQGVLISACALGDSIPPQKKRVGRGTNPKTDARSSRHNHPVPPDCFYDSTGAALISRRSVCSPRKVE